MIDLHRMTHLRRYLGKDSMLSLPEHTRKLVALPRMQGPVEAMNSSLENSSLNSKVNRM